MKICNNLLHKIEINLAAVFKIFFGDNNNHCVFEGLKIRANEIYVVFQNIKMLIYKVSTFREILLKFIACRDDLIHEILHSIYAIFKMGANANNRSKILLRMFFEQFTSMKTCNRIR